MLKKFIVRYRGEFEAEVKAEDISEAIGQFENSEKIKCSGELHCDFFEVLDENGRNLLG